VLELDIGVEAGAGWVRFVSPGTCDGKVIILVQEDEALALSVELRGPHLDSESVSVWRLAIGAAEPLYIDWSCLAQVAPGLLLHSFKDPVNYALEIFVCRVRARYLSSPSDPGVYRVGLVVRPSGGEVATIAWVHERACPAIMNVYGENVY